MEHILPVELRLCLSVLPRRVRKLVRHLLGCPACGQAGAASLDAEAEPAGSPEPAPLLSEYDGVFDASERSAGERRSRLARERQRAVAAVGALLVEDPAAWPRRLERTPELRTLPVVALVLDHAEQILDLDPRSAEARARFAVVLIDRLDDLPRHAGGLLLRYQCRAWSLIGHARACQQDWPQAQQAFDLAARLVSRELLHTDEEAALLEWQARALVDQGRESDALALLGRCADVQSDLGEAARELRALQRQGSVQAALGDLSRAAGLLAWALVVAEEDGRRQQAGSLRYQIAWILLADDQVETARELLAHATVTEDPRQLPVLLHFLADPTLRPGGMDSLRVHLIEAHRRDSALEVAVCVLLLARQAVRDERPADLASLTLYAAEASASPQLAPAAREILGRFASALPRPRGITVPFIVEVAQSLRLADEAAEPGAERGETFN